MRTAYVFSKPHRCEEMTVGQVRARPPARAVSFTGVGVLSLRAFHKKAICGIKDWRELTALDLLTCWARKQLCAVLHVLHTM